jgi:hypothetical protein
VQQFSDSPTSLWATQIEFPQLATSCGILYETPGTGLTFSPSVAISDVEMKTLLNRRHSVSLPASLLRGYWKRGRKPYCPPNFCVPLKLQD